jgi:hypothetical protein
MKPSADFLIDRRVVERHIEKGLVSRSDVDTRLAGLPDLSSSHAVTSIPIVRVSTRRASIPRPLIQKPVINIDDLPYDDEDDVEDDD